MKSKISKIFLDDAGSFLGRGEGCLIVRDRKRNVEKYPLFENEIGEVQIKIGNSVSSGALATCAFWNIDCLITTQRGNPVAYLKSLEDDSHVKTRISQYEALKNEKGMEITKKIVFCKAQGQNELLKKYGLRQHDLIKIKESVESIETANLQSARKKLLSIEGKYTEFYFRQIFPMFPQAILKTDKRRTYKAYDGINNTFNLAYTVLKWRTLSALIKAKLEPFLGFLHSEQFGKPSLACDLMEMYRFLVDDFIIQFTKNLRKRNFILQGENFSSNKKGKREYLQKDLAKDMMRKLNAFFETTVEIPRVKHGNKQQLESLLNEESLILAKYLRGETSQWIPRVPKIVA
jgi:CRISPR-associated protein Cas1